MKLTRKFLANLGIEEEKADEIIAVHSETVTNLKDELDAAKAEASKLPTVQKELDALKTAVDDANSGENPFEVKYNELKAEFDDYKAKQAAEAAKRQKEDAYRALLRDVGVSEKRIDAVIRVTDLESVKIDKDGKFEDAAALKKNVKEEWSEFIETEKTEGATTATPPANTGAGGYTSKSEIMSINDPETRQKAIADNIHLFQKGAVINDGNHS